MPPEDGPSKVGASATPPRGAAGDASLPPQARSGRVFPKHLVEIYDIDGMLGAGAFSTVWRCTHRATGVVRAVKKIDTSELSPREIAHEIALMRLLRHENVVRCYDVFLEAQFVNVVVDMFQGGDLIDGMSLHHSTAGLIPDVQLARIARQMLAAVAHVHSLLIVHRDVKGENFLADRPDIGDPECRVALADFGTAQRLEPGETLSTQVGTPAFWAPEVWEGQYEYLVDVWAVGVTTFILMAGKLPFESSASCPSPRLVMPKNTPAACSSFITSCLEADARARPIAADLTNHEWLTARLDAQANGFIESAQKNFVVVGRVVFGALRGSLICCCSCLGALLLSMCEPEPHPAEKPTNSE